MSIITRLNALREERRNLLTEANACESTDRLTEIRNRLNDLNGEIETMECIRDQMGDATERVDEAQQSRPREDTFGEQLQRIAIQGYERTGRRLNGIELRNNVASGQNETVSADGGALLTPTVTTELLKGVREQSFFLPKMRRLNVGPNSNSIEMPYWPDKNRSDGGRYGGAKAYWMSEADKYTATKTQFATRSIKLAKLGALGYATEEMLRDSTYLESIMTDAFISAMTWEVDEAAFMGAGTVEAQAAKPLGMLHTSNKALITVAKETEQEAATITPANILKMYNQMAPECRNRAVWLINPDIETMLMQMVMTGGKMEAGTSFGQFVYMPPNGLSAQPFGTLLGRPVIPNEHASAVGAVGDIAFIDPTEYFWMERDGLRQATSVHVRFEYDEMAFKFTWRCNGMPSWYEAATPAKGATKRSPYVTLAARG